MWFVNDSFPLRVKINIRDMGRVFFTLETDYSSQTDYPCENGTVTILDG